jgi:hypothetical protein
VLDPANKGYKMMLKLGFSPGDSLGKKETASTSQAEGRVTDTTTTSAQTAGETPTDDNAAAAAAASDWVQSRAEPLRLVVKEDRGGIGLDSEKKRKFRADVAGVSKKSKAEEGEYRERMRLEREERRVEAQVHAAQKVAEKLDADTTQSADATQSGKKTTSSINVLYRGLVREREERERDRLVRQTLESSLPSSFFPKPRLPGTSKEEYEDELNDDEDDGKEEDDGNTQHSFFEQDQETEDPELDEFNALAAGEKLQRLVLFLREKHWYCFWCKSHYEDSGLEGCPGITEEDHD